MNKEQKKPQEDLLSDCCHAAFNPMGFEREDGLWQEKCLQCGKPCEPIWTQKPQEDYSWQIPDPWYSLRAQIIDFFLDIDDQLPDDLLQANASLLVSRIKDNFIAKRDLRKLLEEKKRVMAHIVGAKRVETPYVIIADILAEIEKI